MNDNLNKKKFTTSNDEAEDLRNSNKKKPSKIPQVMLEPLIKD